jgi:hypothetical protein
MEEEDDDDHDNHVDHDDHDHGNHDDDDDDDDDDRDDDDDDDDDDVRRLAGAVTALEPSPALDVVAVGMADGRIVLLNLKFDKAIFGFKQERVVVTALSFRTDASALDTPMLASGAADGQVWWW